MRKDEPDDNHGTSSLDTPRQSPFYNDGGSTGRIIQSLPP